MARSKVYLSAALHLSRYTELVMFEDLPPAASGRHCLFEPIEHSTELLGEIDIAMKAQQSP